MGLRESVLKELDVQEKISGKVEHKDLILRILDACKYESEFFALCNVYHHRYGVLSYQTHRFYSVKSHLLPLMEAA